MDCRHVTTCVWLRTSSSRSHRSAIVIGRTQHWIDSSHVATISTWISFPAIRRLCRTRKCVLQASSQLRADNSQEARLRTCRRPLQGLTCQTVAPEPSTCCPAACRRRTSSSSDDSRLSADARVRRSRCKGRTERPRKYGRHASVQQALQLPRAPCSRRSAQRVGR